MDLHHFRLHFDPHLPEILDYILLFSRFPFRAIGLDYLNKEMWFCVKISCHVAWMRIAVPPASWDGRMKLKRAYGCQGHGHKLVRERKEQEICAKSSMHWKTLELTLATVLSAASFMDFRGNKIMMHIVD